MTSLSSLQRKRYLHHYCDPGEHGTLLMISSLPRPTSPRRPNSPPRHWVRISRAALKARQTPSTSSSRVKEAVPLPPPEDQDKSRWMRARRTFGIALAERPKASPVLSARLRCGRLGVEWGAGVRADRGRKLEREPEGKRMDGMIANGRSFEVRYVW